MSATSLTPGQNHRLRTAKNNLATVLVTLSFVLALIPLVWMLWTVLSKGLHAITRNGWFTQSQRGITYRDPGGGVPKRDDVPASGTVSRCPVRRPAQRRSLFD